MGREQEAQDMNSGGGIGDELRQRRREQDVTEFGIEPMASGEPMAVCEGLPRECETWS